MNITLHPLSLEHFPLMLQWLNAPHVHQWWNPETEWTLEKIEEKYTPYTQGYKLVKEQRKPIYAYIIEADNIPIGYFQIYNAYDFDRNPPLQNLPPSLGSFDIFIGESKYLHAGLGTATIHIALTPQYNFFKAIVVDTHIENNAARRAYEKVGFTIIEIDDTTENIRMLKII